MIRILLLAALSAADDIPQWVRQSATVTVPAYPAKVSAVTLLQEEYLSIEPDGKRVMRERGAVKCIARSGLCRASALRNYNAKSGRIRDFRGWLIPPGGKEIQYSKDRIVDGGYADDTVEIRTRHLDTGDDLKPGAVFAWEIIEEEKTVFSQVLHPFQGSAPVLVSRFTVVLPQGWELRSQVFNRDQTEPQVSGDTYTWELRDLLWMEREPYSPGLHTVVPRLAITFFPTSGAAVQKAMKDWPAVSAWLTELSADPSQITPAIQAKADQLTAGSKDELGKIKAIAAFVQQTRYVSVQMNLTRGGGYVPNRAADVLTRNYGDCKDKANLMRSLLKAAGIESHLTAIFSGAREYVRPEWASTHQFNHMIIAVRVSPEVQLPTVIEHAPLGRLLIFDPTDPYTPVGGLDEEEQGSHALIIAGSQGALLRMPLLPPASNRVETETSAALNGEGALTATAHTVFHGQSASDFRGITSRQSPTELRRVFESVLAAQLGGVRLNTLEHDDSAPGTLRLTLGFNANRFGQIMQGRLLLVVPGALLPDRGVVFAAKERKLPVKLPAQVRHDRVKLSVPAGFVIDELPDPVKFSDPYGTYAARWSVNGSLVEFEQSLELRSLTAPSADYAKVRSFFDSIARSSQNAVVLVHK